MLSRVAPSLPFVLVMLLTTGASADVGLWPTTIRASPIGQTTTTTTTTTTTMDADESVRLQRSVVEVAGLVLKERLRRLSDDDVGSTGGGPGCLAEPGCRARAAAKLGVDELARVEMTLTGQQAPWATAHLTVWRSDGSVAFDASQDVASDRDLRGLLTRAFDPARATARLDVTGLAADDTLLIDGLPGDARSLLAPGPHTVVVLHADHSRTTQPVTLAFEERRVLAVDQRLAPGAAAPSPGLLPAVVGGAVVVVGLAGTGVALWQAASLIDPRQRDVAVVAGISGAVVTLLGGVTVAGALWPEPVSTTEVVP